MSSRPIASQSHTVRLSSFNGSEETTRRENNHNSNGSATVARGIITNRSNNPNSNCDKEEEEYGHHQQQQQNNNSLSHNVHLNDYNRRIMDQYRNGILSPLPSLISSSPPVRQNITENLHNVRYQQRIPPPSAPSSFSVNKNNSSAAFLTLIRTNSGALSTQKLDHFLDLYEEKHGLEPLDKNQVQGLSTMSSLRSLLSGVITVVSGNKVVESSLSSADNGNKQTVQKDLRKAALIQSTTATPCSLDLSQMPVATLVQDDIQDKRLNNNNNSKDNLDTQSKKQPLSPIKEEGEHNVKNIRRNAMSQKNSNPNQRRQSEVKDATICASAQQAIKESTSSKASVDNAEKGTNSKKQSSSDAVSADVPVKKTPGLRKVALAPQPQRIDNLTNAIANGEGEEKKIVKKECKVAATPEVTPVTTKCLAKTPIETPPSKIQNTVIRPQLQSANATTAESKSSSASFSQKSKIPLPLPKTKAKTVDKEDRTWNSNESSLLSSHSSKVLPSSSSSYCTISCSKGGKSNAKADIKVIKQVRQPDTTATVEKAGDKIMNGQNNIPLKKPILVRPAKTSSAKTSLQTDSNKVLSSNNNINLGTGTKPELPPVTRKIGEGDEIAECLSLIDGLSGHTTWVINKLLELPVSDEDAIRRFKKLKESPGVGDFFGVPYIQKEVLAHLLFRGKGITEKTVKKVKA